MTVTADCVTYRYPGPETPALDGVSVAIEPGEFLLVCGSSGGGKSTFLRLFNGLVPQFYGGEISGRVDVFGLDPLRAPARQLALQVGLVFQEPEAQTIVETVEDELAFGMEQHGVAPAEMGRRIDDLLGRLEIEWLRHRRIATLSGGERQRVAIAAVLALEPRLLLLDEPTSQLDPHGAEEVIAALEGFARRGDLAILLAEHRLARVLPVVSGVLEVESGLLSRMTPREAAAGLRSAPPVVELGRRLGLDPLPLTVTEARVALAARPALRAVPRPAPAPGDLLLEVQGASVSYGEFRALNGVSLRLHEGEVVALVGANGSGKSTLFRAISGLAALDGGEVRMAGAPAPAAVAERTAFAGLVPQDPALALYHDTVAAEVLDTLKARQVDRPAAGVLREWGIEEHAGRDPRDISAGQQERVAIGAMLAHDPRVWLLDEPTRGADGRARDFLAARLRDHASAGGAAIVATHDLEAAARWATRVVGLDEGQVAFDLPANEAFAAGGPVPTQVALLVAGAIAVEDVAT